MRGKNTTLKSCPEPLFRAAFETLEKLYRGTKAGGKDEEIPSWAAEDICAIPKYVLSDEQGE